MNVFLQNSSFWAEYSFKNHGPYSKSSIFGTFLSIFDQINLDIKNCKIMILRWFFVPRHVQVTYFTKIMFLDNGGFGFHLEIPWNQYRHKSDILKSNVQKLPLVASTSVEWSMIYSNQFELDWGLKWGLSHQEMSV